MSSLRFVADGMLGTLARKLRMFGFDTLYYNGIEDSRLITISKSEERVLLTCDRVLFQRAVNSSVKSILLEGSDDLRNMVHVLRNNGIRAVEFLPDKSRCPLCNSLLDARNKAFVKNLIPDRVVQMHERFYFCDKCNKVYWEGSHLEKLQQFGVDVMRRLISAT